ncbi:MAG: CoA transferase [Dehalococcoidia bacterium]|nr:CoA transferase [Dehalococcoidia bacterium]
MAPMALSNIRVLDFTQTIAGPYCTKLLADYGADVIKVERPGTGDGARSLGPFPKDEPHPEKSGTFLHLNTNKRSITIDLTTAQGQEIARSLASQVDVVVESFRPGTMESFGLGYEELSELNPALTYTSISNFGQTGPYRDWRGSEVIFYGMGGELYSTGVAEKEPVKLGGTVGLYQSGVMAAFATLGAVLGSKVDGSGQHIDISLMEVQTGSIDRRMSMLMAYQYNGEITERVPLGDASGAGGYPAGVYPCEDGFFQITGGGKYFERVRNMMGNPEELSGEEWLSPAAQADEDMQGLFEAYFYPWLLDRSKHEAWSQAQASRVLCGPLNTMADYLNDETFRGRGAFEEVDHPVAGTFTYPGRPFMMDASPWSIRRPAPLLGQHTEEVLTELGMSRGEVESLKSEGVI